MVVPGRRLVLVLAGLVAAAPPAARGQAVSPLELVQTFPDNVPPGSPVTVDIRLRNVSTLPVDGVQVLDDPPAGYEPREAEPAPERSPNRLSWSVGRLAPGEERHFRLTLAPPRDAAPRSFRNVVDVAYAARLSSARVARVAGPDLSLEVQAPEAVAVGSPATVWLTLRNRGDAAASNVVLQTLLPEGLAHPQGSDLESPLGALPPGGQRTLPLAVTARRGGAFRVRVSAQAEGVAAVVREVAVVADEARFTVTPGGPAVLPQQLTGLFEVAVRNDGGAACPVAVWVQLPAGMEFVRAADGGAYDRQAHAVRWDLGELRPGGRRVLAWNGLPRSAGEMVCRVRLASRDRVVQESSWTVRVVAGGGAD
jgi:uncharacterized repeat protein (TIGR01451 family)